MSNAIDAVVFDLGGVLIDWNPRHLYRKLFQDEEQAMEWFLSNICTPEWNSRQDAGGKLSEASEALICRHPEHEALIRAYYDRWEEMIGGPIDGAVEILREVRDSPYRLYALTNWSAETFPVACERFDFLNWFEGIVVSGEVRMIKPHPEIFHHLMERFELKPEQTVFIDDLPSNVEAARTMGFRAIRFQEPDQLRRELEELGVRLNGRPSNDQ